MLVLTEDLTMSGNNIVMAGTETVDGVDVSQLIEQSAAFPGAPSEGDFHYDEDDDSLYRYNGEAEAWVEVGTMGAIASSTDNLGNHTATEDLAMGGFAITGVGNVDGLDISTHVHDADTLQCDNIASNAGDFDLQSVGDINMKPTSDNDDYLQFQTIAGIPRLAVQGGSDVYINLDNSTWQTIHADAFTEHSEPLPLGTSTNKILNIKNIDGKLDHKTLPTEAYYADKEGKEEGMKLGAMVMHLTKTIQELELRIKELEAK